MKKILITFALLLFTCSYAAFAQGLLAFHVVGDVKYKKGTAMVQLVMNARVPANTVISIPAGGKVEFLDEAKSTRISLSKAGNGSITALSKEQGNSISKIANRYMAYVKKQMTNTQLVSSQRYTDFATVTREKEKKKEEPKDPFRAAFDDFAQKSHETFDSFRDECNKKYTDFVRKIWKEFPAQPYKPVPKDNMVKPEITKDTVSVKPKPINQAIQEVIIPKKEMPLPVLKELKNEYEEPQPEPIEEIKEVVPVTPEQHEQAKFEEMPVSFFGTDLTVRLGEDQRINLGEINPDRVADALDYLSSKKYDNLLYDCLKIRKDKKLCDWAYLMFLKTVSDQFCGEGTPEASLLCGWLYYQSGYKIRYASDESKHLYLFIASKHYIYGRHYPFFVDNEWYFPLGETPDKLFFCQAKFEKEHTLSLFIKETPGLKTGTEYKRTLRAKHYPDFSIEVGVNPNLLDFYTSYPASCINDDFSTKWQMYANTPMDNNVKEQIYPSLKKQLAGKSKKEAVARLLDLVQSIKYEYDDSVWGHDRSFFAEESLHYPSCDCEDRSILLTRLVRDLLDLPCVLIYYPGHLACAMHFEDGQVGTVYEYNGVQYTLCDGTYLYAAPGEQMTMFNKPDNGVVVIPIE